MGDMDIPKRAAYELVPMGQHQDGDCTRVTYECPSERCGHEIAYLALAYDLTLGTTVVMDPANKPQSTMLAWVYEEMWGHVNDEDGHGIHTVNDWLLALADQEDAYENEIAKSNRDNERAWRITRDTQQTLQELRTRLADYVSAASETEGVFGRLKTLLRATVESAPSYAQERYLAIEALTILGEIHQDPDLTEPCSEECQFLAYECKHKRAEEAAE